MKMFYSLIQTLVCVLLINGGLYALHLKGNNGDISSSSLTANPPNAPNIDETSHILLTGSQLQALNPSREHVQHAGGAAYKPYESAAGRLTEQLADLAQLDRERLMMLGIAKQTAASAAATGHHGRPIITGRIHMSPTEDLVSEGDYGGILMPSPPHGYMFGHVIKQPTTATTTTTKTSQNNAENLGLAGEFTGGGIDAGGTNLRPIKYEYGRVVQPANEPEYDAQHIPLDLDAFIELEQEQEQEQEPEMENDDDDFDLDSYQYLDELFADQQQQQQQQQHHRSNTNPYQTLEQVETVGVAPLALRELFHNKDHNKQQQQINYQHAQTRNAFNPTNIRLQQKWQRKRAQQLPLQRNIFGQKNKHLPMEPHYFNQRHHSLLSSIGSEATANKNTNNNNNNNKNNPDEIEQTKTINVLDENLKSAVKNLRNHNNNQEQQLQQQQQQQQQQTKTKSNSHSNTLTSQQQKQQKSQDHQENNDELLAHPNHKRSGGGLMPAGLSAASSHSIASQLMLRSARGQRQYDVPQIECPTAMDGMERFACPTPDLQGRYRCIDDHVLCDGFIDCPEGEDEDRRSCMFYKTTKAHLDVLADALLRWARGR